MADYPWHEVAREIEPFFPLFESVFASAERRVKLAVDNLGPSHKTERASDWHRAVRDNFQQVDDAADSPIFKLTDGPDGDGLDYVTITVASPVQLRWGHAGSDIRIRRNDTSSTRQWQESFAFAAQAERAAREKAVPKLTLGYTLADDVVTLGKPRWWLSKLLLLREGRADSRLLAEVARFVAPPEEAVPDAAPSPTFRERQREAAKWAEMIRKIG